MPDPILLPEGGPAPQPRANNRSADSRDGASFEKTRADLARESKGGREAASESRGQPDGARSSGEASGQAKASTAKPDDERAASATEDMEGGREKNLTTQTSAEQRQKSAAQEEPAEDTELPASLEFLLGSNGADGAPPPDQNLSANALFTPVNTGSGQPAALAPSNLQPLREPVLKGATERGARSNGPLTAIATQGPVVSGSLAPAGPNMAAVMANGQQAGGGDGGEGGRTPLELLFTGTDKTDPARSLGTDGRFADTLGRQLQGPGVPAQATQTAQSQAGAREGLQVLRQYTTSIDVPVNQAQWGEKVAGKIAWLAGQGIQAAEIHIDPPDLGPVEVRLRVQNEQASVVMHAQNSSVRDLLELNGHRLREMFQQSGLDLTQMDVSDQSPRERRDGPGQGGDTRGGGGLIASSEEDSLMASGQSVRMGEVSVSLKGEVDLYA